MQPPVIITCALTGGMTVPAQSAAIPVTVDEIVRQGLDAAEAGASVLHVHVRDEVTGAPSADVELFRKICSRLVAGTDAIVQLTTGGGRGMTVEERAGVLALEPEMATLNAGSFNFGIYPVAGRDLPFEPWERDYLEGTRDYVFKNSFSDIRYLASRMTAAGTVPEVEVYDVGQIFTLRQLVKEGVLQTPLDLQFVLGVLGANAAEPDQLIHMLRTAERVLGAESFVWSVAGVGYPAEFELAALATTLGGNVRVGLEDNLRLSRTRPARSNAELVAKVRDLLGVLDRRPAEPDESRRILGIRTRSDREQS
ncbi:3-keto-5-aminohexanoate cleavage protein [Kribbella sp. NPDC049227]|uniref:3-keto-5-aminohexanoate cleavage protein n=1 Tax=Kribbella sp. NPDC049227 TaxID=3364113 RepID=UPI0037177D52